MATLDVDMGDVLNLGHAGGNLSESETNNEEDDSTDESSVDEGHVVPKGLPDRSLPTGLCYDERMRYHAEVSALSAEAVHPEDPRRIYYIFKELCEAGLVKAAGYELMVDQPLYRIDAREAQRIEITLVHTDEHYEFVKSTSSLSNAQLIDLSENPQMDSIYFNKLSYFSGKLSAGGAIETCKAVMDGKVKNAIAVIRPPGHHAEVHSTMGFCLFNNTCIASRVCQKLYEERCRKILILDWDVHHGNGCQKAFYHDPNILYISLHVHQGGKFYPSGPEGGMDRCGAGQGLGYNINIPWESKGMGDGDYMYAFQHVVMPIAYSFDPDLVIVSAGFDAAAGDELGGCNVSPACYAHMTHMLMSLAKGRVAVCLEGGYNFRAISRSALAVTRTLMGEPPDRLEPTRATDSAVKVIEQVKRIQSQFWRCMYPKAPTSGIYEGEKLHDIIRKYQAQHLFDKYKLTELHILRDRISESFKKQVLATLNLDKQKRLIILFHDPPDLLAENDPLVAQQKPSNTWLLDASQTYIEQAVQSDIAIIDVNIPDLITVNADQAVDVTGRTNEIPSDARSSSVEITRAEAAKLATYIWDNYAASNEFAAGIWLIGAGNAFDAVMKLLCEKDDVVQRVKGVVAFVSKETQLKSMMSASNSNQAMMAWYRENTRIYVAKDHVIWEKEKAEGKRSSKRYGKLIPTDELILNSMMRAKLGEVMKYIHDTCDKDKLMDSQDEDVEDPDDNPYGQAPRRSEALTSPPQNRPVASTATAQTSAALHNVISPTRGSDSTTGAARSTMGSRAVGSSAQDIDEDMTNSMVTGQQVRPGNPTTMDTSPPRQP